MFLLPTSSRPLVALATSILLLSMYRSALAQSLAPAEPGSKYLFGTEVSTDADQGSTGKPRTDKSQYNLFNPTPDDLLREFSSSRPDQTTGPHSVDAGHYYLETGVAYSLGLGATPVSR